MSWEVYSTPPRSRTDAWYALDCPPPNTIRTRVAVRLMLIAGWLVGS